MLEILNKLPIVRGCERGFAMRCVLNRLYGWTGFREKTLWDWMSLLIVPLVIVVATAVLSYFESEREKRRADALVESENRRLQAQQQIETDRARQILLQSYIQDMTRLLLDKGLATSKPNQPIRHIARSSTLSATRQLDPDRKGILLQFLYESNLIGTYAEYESSEQVDPIIYLCGANLEGVDLSFPYLEGTYNPLYDTDLSGADLSGANLSRANLSGANLSFAFLNTTNLSGANLSPANLSGASLLNASLFGANLTDADLSGANLSGASLFGANLSRANLSGADLTDADLSSTKGWTNDQLAQARSVVGAILPDGTKMTEEAWEEFKKRYG
jgi:uncharacterized protein YjbI with pentapeptide repeats